MTELKQKQITDGKSNADKKSELKKMMPLHDYLGYWKDSKPSLLHRYIFEAAGKGDLDAVKSALDAGAEAHDCHAYWEYTVVRTAAEAGHADVVKLLIERGGRIDVEGGHRAFLGAIACMHLDVVKVLVSFGADVNKLYFGLDTPISKAAERGAIEIVEFLLSSGADIEKRAIQGKTAMMAAVESGQMDMAKWLISKGAKIESRDDFGKTALGNSVFHMFEDKREVEIVRMLIAEGADVNAADKGGYTPLMNSAGRRFEIVELLVSQGAEVNARSEDGTSALMMAVSGRRKDAAEFLISKGADVNVTDNDGMTPLMIAAGQEKEYRPGEALAMASMLISNGGDAKAWDSTGKTALMFAAEKGNLGVVNLLVVCGVGVDEKDCEGATALMLVSGSSHLLYDEDKSKKIKVLEELVRLGADINARDQSGKTALSYAITSGDIRTAQFLLRKGGVV